ncbi:hypothetical protein Btru_052895 [Bulinus truncatus]|nr:hypothetical protein Btru_052895 [Bulinus truncatus]
MKSSSKIGKLKSDFEANTIEVFEKRYSTLNQAHCLKKEPKIIDFVLIHPEVPNDLTLSKTLESQIKLREAFENKLASQGFDIKKITHEKLVYTILHCPFKRLCVEAEKVKLEMPLKNMIIKRPPGDFFQQFLNKHFETDHDDLRTKDEIAEEMCDSGPLLVLLKFQHFESSKVPGCLEMKSVEFAITF